MQCHPPNILVSSGKARYYSLGKKYQDSQFKIKKFIGDGVI